MYPNNTDLIVVCIFCNSGDKCIMGIINGLPIIFTCRDGGKDIKPVCSNVEYFFTFTPIIYMKIKCQ